jgi:type II secretory pathway pseudopilin PulG
MLYPFFRLCRPARSPASCGPAARKKKGFNLIESAVVLGVVGLVIGGIWVGAAALNEQWNVTRHAQQIQLIANRTMALLKGQSYSVGVWSSVTPELLAAGVFPEDMSVVSGDPRNVWGGIVSVNLAPGSPVTQFAVSTRGLDYAACTKMVFAVAGSFKDGSFLEKVNTAKMDDSNAMSVSVPLTITPHNNWLCNRSEDSKVFFFFKFPLS